MSMSGARKPDRPGLERVNLSETVAKPVRKFVFDYFLENSRAPVLEEVMQSFHLARSEARDVLEELETAHHVIRLPGTQRILMANPFLSTGHTVRGQDRQQGILWRLCMGRCCLPY